MILEQRARDPERVASHDKDMTNLEINEKRMIEINSTITLFEPPIYSEAIRNNQERLT